MKTQRPVPIFCLVMIISVLLLTACSGNVGQNKNSVSSTIVPEDIQTESIAVDGLAELPTFEYSEQEIPVSINGQSIFGVAYIPQGDRVTYPLMICSHGLGGTYRSCATYAEQLASHGIAAYCFDFRGGGGSRSDGSTTEMSVMTEVADLEAILNAVRTWGFVDVNKIALLGTSQGGIVSAIAAARHTNEINGLILCYPAFIVHDDIHKTFSSLDDVPDTFSYQWITAGKIYVTDMWDYDVYAEIGNYNKPVLLMHGSSDSIVPMSYADRAAEAYSDVDYYVISGAGHGFNGNAFEDAVEHIFEYARKIGLLETSNQSGTSNNTSGMIQVTIGDTTGFIELKNNTTSQAFIEMLPLTVQMNDLHGREYWFSHSMSYDEADVVNDYAPGQFTYWCGGWVTAYYDRDDDNVIEDGSVVIGIMDDSLVEAFKALQGTTKTVTFSWID